MLNRRKKYSANSKRIKYLMKSKKIKSDKSLDEFFRLLKKFSEIIIRKAHITDFFSELHKIARDLIQLLDNKLLFFNELRKYKKDRIMPTVLNDFFDSLESFINATIKFIEEEVYKIYHQNDEFKNIIQANFLNFITYSDIFLIDIYLANNRDVPPFKNSLFIQYLYSPQYNSIFSFDRFINVINQKYETDINPIDYEDVDNFDKIKEAFKKEVKDNNKNFDNPKKVIDNIMEMFEEIITKESTNKEFLLESIESPIKFKDITTQGFYRRKNIDENVEKNFFDFLKDIKNDLTYMGVAKKVRGAIINGKINPAEGVRVGSEFEQEIKTRLKNFGFVEVVLPQKYTATTYFEKQPEKFIPGTFVSQPNGNTNPPDFYIFFNEKMLKLECKSTTSNSIALGSTIPDQETLYLVLKADHRDLSGDGFCTFFYGKNLLSLDAEQELKEFKINSKSTLNPNNCLITARSLSNFFVNLPASFNDELRFLLENYVLYASDFFDTYDNVDNIDDDPDINFVDFVTGNILLYKSELIEDYKKLIDKFKIECGLKLKELGKYLSYLKCQEFIIKNKNLYKYFYMIFLNKKETKTKIKVKRNFNDDDEICCCVNHSTNLDLSSTLYKSQNLKLYKIDDNTNRYICHICLVNNVKNHKIQRWTVDDDKTPTDPVLFFYTDKNRTKGSLYAPREYKEIEGVYYERIATIEQLKNLININGIDFKEKLSDKNNLEKWMRETDGNIKSMKYYTRGGEKKNEIKTKLEKIIVRSEYDTDDYENYLEEALIHIQLDEEEDDEEEDDEEEEIGMDE